MEEKKPFELEIDETKAQGVYANLVMITHSPSEIILDFARIMPGLPKAKVQSRIIMTPPHAKLFLKALEDNIKKYEARFGEIKLHGLEERRVGFNPTEEKK
ncbi:MAG TPA: DUF3467 domain-containing protein [candidate division WOR-3 bacterium]|uniref:DUF3467 domain-containing protein n=1 Tax=candidate division WOR-3 bacterium TaxID=2052148 RepID=A0A7C5I4X8_UNCW3|nr:DUF3467 domain-containing protein [candidate division WOR-3 bacterium]